MKAESIKSKPIKIGELVSAFVLDLTTARRQKERGKKNEEKIISSRNEYGICNRNVSRMRKQHKRDIHKRHKEYRNRKQRFLYHLNFPVCGSWLLR